MLSDFSPEVDWNVDCSQPVDSLPANFLARLEKRGGRNVSSRRSTSRGERGVSKKSKNASEKGPTFHKPVLFDREMGLKHLLHLGPASTNSQLDQKTNRIKGIGGNTAISQMTNLEYLEKFLPSRRRSRNEVTDKFNFKPHAHQLKTLESNFASTSSITQSIIDSPILKLSAHPGEQGAIAHSGLRSTLKFNRANFETKSDRDAKKPLALKQILNEVVPSQKKSMGAPNNIVLESSGGTESDFNSSILDDDLILASQAVLDEDDTENVHSKTAKTLTSNTNYSNAISTEACAAYCSQNNHLPKLSEPVLATVKDPVIMNDSLDSLFVSKSQPISTDEGFDSNDDDFLNLEIQSDDSFAQAVQDFAFDEDKTVTTKLYQLERAKTSAVVNQKAAEPSVGTELLNSKSQHVNQSSLLIRETNLISAKPKSTPRKSNTFKRCASFQEDFKRHQEPLKSNILSQIELKRLKALEKLNKKSKLSN